MKQQTTARGTTRDRIKSNRLNTGSTRTGTQSNGIRNRMMRRQPQKQSWMDKVAGQVASMSGTSGGRGKGGARSGTQSKKPLALAAIAAGAAAKYFSGKQRRSKLASKIPGMHGGRDQGTPPAAAAGNW